VFLISKHKKSFYDILEINEDATTQEIKRAYKKLAREYHPDVVANSDDQMKKEKAKKIMVKLNNAKDTLLNPTKRAEYDIILNESRGEGSFVVEAYDDGIETIEVFDVDDDSDLELDSEDKYEKGSSEYRYNYDYSSDYDLDAQEHLAAEVEEEPDWDHNDESKSTTDEILYPDFAPDHEQEQAPTEVSDIDQTPDTTRIKREVFTFCPKCGAENAENNDFCFNCNTRLIYYRQSRGRAHKPPQRPPPSEPEPTWIPPTQRPTRLRDSGMIACPNCGANNFASSEYCYFCNVNLRYYRGRAVRSRPPPPARGRGSEPEPGMPLRDDEMVTCQECGAGNFPGSLFCRICHKDLKYDQKTTMDDEQYEVEDQYSSLVICPNCGAKNFENSSSCYFCHTSLVFYQPPSTPEKRENKAITRPKTTSSTSPKDKITVECPKCEHEVLPEQTYCYYCGYTFPKFIKLDD
jgi:curved DNA-binding protein CbpA